MFAPFMYDLYLTRNPSVLCANMWLSLCQASLL